MSNMEIPVIPETVPIFVLDNPTIHTYPIHFSKYDFITFFVNPTITHCPKLAIIWNEVLKEPLKLGYIPWNSMVLLMTSLYKHDTTDHACQSIDWAHVFIVESLLYCRSISFPPFPGGEDVITNPYYSVTRAKIPQAYDHFEREIFKGLDRRIGYRMFSTIRLLPKHTPITPTFIYHYGSKVYRVLEHLRLLPPALEEPDDTIPDGI